MAGGGLRLANLVDVLRRSGVSCLHGSLARKPDFNGSAADRLEGDVRETVRLMRIEFAEIEVATRAV
jgi:hypothetical protein